MMYLRFIVCLSVGLLGLGMFLKALFDGVLYDWDIVADLRKAAQDIARKRRYVQVELDSQTEAPRVMSRVVAERRRVARELPDRMTATPITVAPVTRPVLLQPRLN